MYDELSIKPIIHIDSKQFPDVKKMEINEEYELIVKIKIKGVYAEGNNVVTTAEICDIAVPAPTEEEIEIMSMDSFTKFASKKKKDF